MRHGNVRPHAFAEALQGNLDVVRPRRDVDEVVRTLSVRDGVTREVRFLIDDGNGRARNGGALRVFDDADDAAVEHLRRSQARPTGRL